jgi:ATP-dependent RNA helicase DeaD
MCYILWLICCGALYQNLKVLSALPKAAGLFLWDEGVMMTTAFDTLGLCPALEQTVTELGYTQPTPIQAGMIPLVLAGRDVLGQAQTGTGKTAAFALPMLQRLDLHSPGVQGLVLAPTRELAVQVADAVYRYGHQLGVRVLPIYGGQSYERQQRRLAQGMPVVVGTPGRLLDLLRQGILDLHQVRSLVLDEADAMLQMGFIDDVDALIQATPATRQTILVSATLSPSIRQLALRYMHDPLTVAIDHAVRTVPQTAQRYYLLHAASKVAALTRLLEAEEMTRGLIFVRTRVGAAALGEDLVTRGYPAEALHGDLSQAARETVLHRFRTGLAATLVATDVGARGLDIPEVSHVINFDLPDTAADYVHRVGRTGRAGRAGVAITLVTPQDVPRLRSSREDSSSV